MNILCLAGQSSLSNCNSIRQSILVHYIILIIFIILSQHIRIMQWASNQIKSQYRFHFGGLFSDFKNVLQENHQSENIGPNIALEK